MTDNRNWESLRAQHQARHAAAIAYVRGQIGSGAEYANEVARAVVSDAGAYFELRELPEEFVGAVGDGVEHRMLSAPDVELLLRRVRSLVGEIQSGAYAPPLLSLYVLYAGASLRAQSNLFVFDYRGSSAPPLQVGAWQADLPRALKLRVQRAPGDAPLPGLPPSGVVLLIAPSHTDGGQHLCMTMTRTAETTDLSGAPDISANPN